MELDQTDINIFYSSLTAEEEEVLEKYRNLSEDKKKQALALINNALSSDYFGK